MRIQCPENLRFPSEGSSAEGKSGPKARPNGVVDGQRVNIPVLFFIDNERRRKLGDPGFGFWFKLTRQCEIEKIFQAK